MAPSPRCSKPNPNLLLPAMLGSPNPRAMLRRWTRTSESSIVPGASSNQHSDEEPFDTEPSDCPWPVIKTDKSAQLHVIDLQVCGSPSSRAASPTGNSVVGEGSPIEDSSPVCDESMFAAPTDGTDPSYLVEIQPSVNLERLIRRIIYTSAKSRSRRKLETFLRCFDVLLCVCSANCRQCPIYRFYHQIEGFSGTITNSLCRRHQHLGSLEII